MATLKNPLLAALANYLPDERLRHFKGLARSTSGATAVEYGLLIGIMALGLAGGLGVLSDLVNAIFDMLATVTTDTAANINAEN